jgi:ABC-type antimicrobial peptide transport system permease subunit
MTNRPWRLGATLFSVFGCLALLVAILGIYSTISYGVSQRWHEFGVRLALGARGAQVVRLVVGEGLRLLLAGVMVGVILSLAAARLIASMLYGVRPSDPASLAIVITALIGIGVLAALVPAWRAARVDPVTALRAE